MFKPDKIILHHSLTKDSETVSWNAIRRYHTETKGWSDCGYHFGCELINDHYEVLAGRPLNRIGAHTRGYNTKSIGICFVGNFDIIRPPAGQWEAGLKFVRGLLHLMGLSPADVHGHNEYNSYKTCPGTLFDMNGFRERLKTTTNS